MAGRTLRPTPWGNKEPKRLRGEQQKKAAPKVFRLSMLNTGMSYDLMPHWANGTLFKVNSEHCRDFDPNIELLPQDVSSYMISSIERHFGIKGRESLAVDGDKVVVSSPLQYDFYNFEVSCIRKLKNRAKPLYIAFSSLIKNVGFQQLEKDPCCFIEDFIDNQIEYEGAKKKYVKAMDRLMKGYEVYDEILNAAVEPQQALKILKAYRGKKDGYRTIAVFLEKWTGIRFFFIDAAPYQFYEVGENHDAMEEHCEIPYRLGFYTTKGEFFEQFLQDENQNRYANQVMCDPCWTIGEENTGEDLRHNIHQFESFCEDLLDILQLIQKL